MEIVEDRQGREVYAEQSRSNSLATYYISLKLQIASVDFARF